MSALKIILTIALLAASAYLGYSLYKTIEEPIMFEAEQTLRDDAAINKLKLVRQAELAYKLKNGTFTGGFDTLINFIKTDSFEVVKQLGDPNDSTIVVKTQISYRTILDSLFDNDSNMAEDLINVPFVAGEQFYLQAQIIVKNEVELPAFQCGVPYETLYKGAGQRKYYTTLLGEDLRVGDLQEGTTAGSWDK
ncbi:MAG: hypothetical protein ACPGXL_02540 [Chitinophagales bacterium]